METNKLIKTQKNTIYNLASAALFILLLAVWQFLSQVPKVSFLFGSPTKIFASLIKNTLNGILIHDFLITGFEALLGFVIGITTGTIIGFVLWYSPFIARLTRPYIIILGAVPIFAFAPMIIVWFGIGIKMKIIMAALGTFLVSLIQSYEGAKSVNLKEFNLLKTFGASRFQTFQKVIIPSSLNWVLTSIKLNVGFALLGAFIGEFISAEQGLGHFMIKAGALYDIPGVLAGSIYLVVLALLLNLIVSLIEKNKIKIVKLFAVSREVRKFSL